MTNIPPTSGHSPGRLTGRVAVVTGGGSGMGRAIGLEFAAEGARAAAADIDLAKAQDAAEEIRRGGGEALAVRVDVTRSAEVRAMAAEVLSRFGAIDILVNNAGVRIVKPFLEHTEEDWHRMIDVNLTGQFLCAQAVLPAMLKKGKGKIINLASVAGFVGRPNRAAYCAAKAGVLGLTRALAIDMAGKNINVNAISPGSIETPMNIAAAQDPNLAWGKETIMGRWGQAGDVARAAVFLASNDSDYITGSDIKVEGGWLAGRARGGEVPAGQGGI
jgi:NAD(P)-dependent dehydrogenase (short-subunit alcohol dehydrogenase family)